MLTTRLARFALVAGAIGFAACAKDKSGTNNGSTSDSASGNVSQNTPAAQPAAPSDADIVAYLDVANMTDSSGGKLASTKGTSSDVKSYGQMMMGEHHALRVAGQKLAKQKNITPNPSGGDSTLQKMQATSQSLQAQAKGAAWDKAYIQNEVQTHEQVLANAKAAHDQTQDADLKKLIEDATPVIQKHLDRARQIQQKLGGSTT
jgi:putative membrane protein